MAMKIDRDKIMESVEEVKKTAAELAKDVKEKAGEAKEKLSEISYDDAKAAIKKIDREKIAASVEEAKKNAAELAKDMKEKAGEAKEKLSDMTYEDAKEVLIEKVSGSATAVKKATSEAKLSVDKFTAKLAIKEVYIQMNGREMKESEILEKIEEEFVAAGNKLSALKELELYIKPEDSAVYYVINSKDTGKIEL